VIGTVNRLRRANAWVLGSDYAQATRPLRTIVFHFRLFTCFRLRPIFAPQDARAVFRFSPRGTFILGGFT
jgi:hypothetical protein